MKRENEPTNNHFLHFISFLAVYSSSSPVESLTRQRRFLVSNSIIARHWVDLTTISSSGPECRKGVRLPGGEVGWVPPSVDDEAERVNTINRSDDDLCCSFATRHHRNCSFIGAPSTSTTKLFRTEFPDPSARQCVLPLFCICARNYALALCRSLFVAINIYKLPNG